MNNLKTNRTNHEKQLFFGFPAVASQPVSASLAPKPVPYTVASQTVTLTMTAYVDGMVEAFKDDLPRQVNTPFPEHDKGFLTRSDKVTDAESELYLKKGYMRTCGLISIMGITQLFS